MCNIVSILHRAPKQMWNTPALLGPSMLPRGLSPVHPAGTPAASPRACWLPPRCMCCQQLQNDLYSVRHIWSPVCTCTGGSRSTQLQTCERCHQASKTSARKEFTPVWSHQSIVHLSLAYGMHMEGEQACKQLSLPTIQMPPAPKGWSAAAAPGTGKGDEGSESDENYWERASRVSCCLKEAVTCQGIGKRLLLGLGHGPCHWLNRSGLPAWRWPGFPCSVLGFS